MLVWFLRGKRPIPIIQMLRGSSRERILGQLRVNAHLREHLRNVYTSPWSVGETQIQEYLDSLRMPRLMAAEERVDGNKRLQPEDRKEAGSADRSLKHGAMSLPTEGKEL
ncbi:hypothetical protein NDU88_005303 [Pleurodeles waltl]|uniref:Uncharacterized protein n=1 Tax=Pleurodeles waltl TaxID=8319 RepID=A0AAV7NUX7_PLEWA|nr:hypothetical protein NDU88_005303 [Pleurodeles waltl]